MYLINKLGTISDEISMAIHTIFYVIFAIVLIGIMAYGAYTLFDIAKQKDNQEQRSRSLKHLLFIGISFIGLIVLSVIVFSIF